MLLAGSRTASVKLTFCWISNKTRFLNSVRLFTCLVCLKFYILLRVFLLQYMGPSVANTALFNQLLMPLSLSNKASVKNAYKMNVRVAPGGLRQTRDVLKPCRTTQAFSQAAPCFFLPRFCLLIFQVCLEQRLCSIPWPSETTSRAAGESGLTGGKGMAETPGTAGKRGRSGERENDFPSPHGSAALPLLSTAHQSCLNATSFIIHPHTAPGTSAFKDRWSNACAWFFSRSDSSIWWKSLYGRKSKKTKKTPTKNKTGEKQWLLLMDRIELGKKTDSTKPFSYRTKNLLKWAARELARPCTTVPSDGLAQKGKQGDKVICRPRKVPSVLRKTMSPILDVIKRRCWPMNSHLHTNYFLK